MPQNLSFLKAIFYTFFLLFVLGCTQKNIPKKSTEEPSSLSKKEFPTLAPNSYNVGFLIMEGTYNTEFTAPYDIFQHTKYRENIKKMNVFTVANTDNAITTFEGLKIIPDYNYLHDPLPRIDILVIPSAEHHLDTDLDNEQLIQFVQKVNTEALYMTSHCDGAFVLAKAGLLKNKVATTFPSDIALMRQKFPEVDIRENVLFVHDAKYITSAGGAKSFEAALYLCEHLYGKEIAQSLAQGLVIDWNLQEIPHLIVNKE